MARKRASAKKAPSTDTSRFTVPARLALALAVVWALGWGAVELWRLAAPAIVQRDRYLLTAQSVELTDPPKWIIGDVRGDVVRDSGLDRRLSILDERFTERIRTAFELHPWIESVDRIEKRFPGAVRVEVTYRKPIAVIELPLAAGVRLAPVDYQATHLPEREVPEIRRRYLPRISGIVGEPPVGQSWDDPRVAGGVELAQLLGDHWERFHLSEIIPSARPEVRKPSSSYYVYELVTRGGTRIVWGAAPSAAAPGESEFHEKYDRMTECIRRVGPLNTVHSPKRVDVRSELRITPRDPLATRPGAPPMETMLR